MTVIAIQLGRITALQKPDRGVRGIVDGDVFRRDVARTIAQYANLGEAATHPFQNVLSTRACTECVTHIVQAMTSEDREATILSVDGIGAYDFVSRNVMVICRPTRVLQVFRLLEHELDRKASFTKVKSRFGIEEGSSQQG